MGEARDSHSEFQRRRIAIGTEAEGQTVLCNRVRDVRTRPVGVPVQIFKVDLRLFLNLGAYLQENAALIKAVGEKERGEGNLFGAVQVPGL